MEVGKEDFYAQLKLWIGLEVDDSTCFFDGIGMDGFEAETLMMHIRDKYSLDLSAYNPYDFHSKDYEVANPLLALWQLMTGRTRRTSSFTALHLYKVVRAGKWFSPPAPAESDLAKDKEA